MRASMVMVLLAIAFAGSACGAAQMAVKAPISNLCASKGLKGCPDLTDGVMDYVNGEKAEAEKKLRAAAMANGPAQMRAFAVALEPIGAKVGGETGEAIKAVAAILTSAEGTAAPNAKAGAAAPDPAPVRASPGAVASASATSNAQPSPNVVLDELRTHTERPATAARTTACGGVFGADPKCTRVRVFVGPLVVTNAYTSGGCPDELFLTAGRLEKPHWILLGPAGTPMNVAGQFILEDGEELHVGVRATGAAPKDDLKCSLTWSGFRPLKTSDRPRGSYLDE